MPETNQNEAKTPATEAPQEAQQEAQQDVVKSSGTKDEPTAKASDELSEDDLEAVAGGRGVGGFA